MLSEHQCKGWLQGYLLSGRDRLFNCYDACIHLIDHSLLTKDKPIIFSYQGYRSLIHQLTYRRTNHPNLPVRGYNWKWEPTDE